MVLVKQQGSIIHLDYHLTGKEKCCTFLIRFVSVVLLLLNLTITYCCLMLFSSWKYDIDFTFFFFWWNLWKQIHYILSSQGTWQICRTLWMSQLSELFQLKTMLMGLRISQYTLTSLLSVLVNFYDVLIYEWILILEIIRKYDKQR